MLSSLDNSLQESALSLHPVGLRDQTQVISLGGKLLYPLSHPTSPRVNSFWGLLEIRGHSLLPGSLIVFLVCTPVSVLRLTPFVRTFTVLGTPASLSPTYLTKTTQEEQHERNCSWFQRGRSMVTRLCASGPIMREHIMALELVEEGAVHLMTDRKQRKIRADQVQYTLVADFFWGGGTN